MENKKNSFLIPFFIGVLITFPITVVIGFILGLMGIDFSSVITSKTDGGRGNITSLQQLDMAVPDPEFCRQWGASAFVSEQKIDTTLNPSTLFFSQPSLLSGCVLGERI